MKGTLSGPSGDLSKSDGRQRRNWSPILALGCVVFLVVAILGAYAAMHFAEMAFEEQARRQAAEQRLEDMKQPFNPRF